MNRSLFLGALAGAGAFASFPASRAVAARAATTLEPLSLATDWLNGALSPQQLRGKVVLVDVFTFACYNCQNITPNLRALARRHDSGLAIVGVHTPETPYEREQSNIVKNLAAQGIVWPVALDPAARIWNAYGVDAWPTQLLFDRAGHLRATIVGDSQDDLVDRSLASLLAEKTPPSLRT